MGKKITGRGENDTGGNTRYQINNNKTVSRPKGVSMAKKGQLPDYHVMKVNNKEYLRANPDSRRGNNVDEQKLI